jgi:hypothetical protein
VTTRDGDTCRTPDDAQRSTSRFCSARCRQRARRGQVVVDPAVRPGSLVTAVQRDRQAEIAAIEERPHLETNQLVRCPSGIRRAATPSEQPT